MDKEETYLEESTRPIKGALADVANMGLGPAVLLQTAAGWMARASVVLPSDGFGAFTVDSVGGVGGVVVGAHRIRNDGRRGGAEMMRHARHNKIQRNGARDGALRGSRWQEVRE